MLYLVQDLQTRSVTPYVLKPYLHNMLLMLFQCTVDRYHRTICELDHGQHYSCRAASRYPRISIFLREMGFGYGLATLVSPDSTCSVSPLTFLLKTRGRMPAYDIYHRPHLGAEILVRLYTETGFGWNNELGGPERSVRGL